MLITGLVAVAVARCIYIQLRPISAVSCRFSVLSLLISGQNHILIAYARAYVRNFRNAINS